MTPLSLQLLENLYCLTLYRSLPKSKREAKRRKISFRQAKEAEPVAKKPLLDQDDNPLVNNYSQNETLIDLLFMVRQRR